MMENTAAVLTGAEQRYMISQSQQRTRCLFKIWGGRGRKWLAPVEIFRREAMVCRKWAPDGWSPLTPWELKPRSKLLGRKGLRACFKAWWIFGKPQEIRILNLQDTLAIILIWYTKPDINLLKVINGCALINKIRVLLPYFVLLLTHTHTPLLS